MVHIDCEVSTGSCGPWGLWEWSTNSAWARCEGFWEVNIGMGYWRMSRSFPRAELDLQALPLAPSPTILVWLSQAWMAVLREEEMKKELRLKHNSLHLEESVWTESWHNGLPKLFPKHKISISLSESHRRWIHQEIPLCYMKKGISNKFTNIEFSQTDFTAGLLRAVKSKTKTDFIYFNLYI